jgi:hypothetical protein
MNGLELLTLERDYGIAEGTLIYLRKRAPSGWNKRILEVITLIPNWMESAPEEVGPARRLGGSSEYALYFRRSRISVAEALAHYSRVRSGVATDITQTAEERAGNAARFTLLGTPVAEEPPWPAVACEIDGEHFWRKSPFWGFLPGGMRRHQLLSPAQPNDTFSDLSSNERTKATTHLKGLLPFELAERPAMFGSCHLVLPNPLFGDVHTRLETATPPKLNVRLHSRLGADLSTLKATFREFRPDGQISVIEVPNVSNLFSVDFGHEPHKVSFEIECASRGVVFSSPPTAFVHSIDINLGLVTSKRKIFVPTNPPGGTPEVFEVPVIGSTTTSTVGSTPPTDGLLLVLKDQIQRKDALEDTQRWFDDVEQAKRAIRDIIAKATHRIRIVDPYFGVRELQSFALATTSAKATIEILSSASHLKEDGHKPGIELAKHVKSLGSQGVTNKIEIRVMMGKKADIHDRFLIVDEQAWLLGASLNEFGSRGTMMVQLRVPDLARAEIDKIWGGATPLEKYVSDAARA